MPLNSYVFVLAFLPISVLGFRLLRQYLNRTFALWWLLLASVFFYAYSSTESLAIILPLILLDFGIARWMLHLSASREWQRKLLLIAGIVANVAFLGYFKYKNFFLDTADTLFATNFQLGQLISPIGISFLVFQAIAFLGDVYSRKTNEVCFLDFLTFALFFPRTVAGPIIHYGEIMPQLRTAHDSSFADDAAVGISLISIGLFKKVITADSLAPFSADAFDTPDSTLPWDIPTALISWVAILTFNFQLYFDFSGYTDMALGSARLFGVRLPMNFNSPFRSTSIVEFWGRWHITLTRFLTEYVYTPMVLSMTRARIAHGKSILQGKRSTFSAIIMLVVVPTMVTMMISGIWHGAGWNFVIFGMLHGIYLSINQCWRLVAKRFSLLGPLYERIMKPVGFGLTFLGVLLALVFFRAHSVASALAVLRGMIGLNGALPKDIQLVQGGAVHLSWSFLEQVLPITAFYWVVLLSLVVTILPNSLELLRRAHPSLDLPDSNRESLAHQGVAKPHRVALWQASFGFGIDYVRSGIERIRIEGAPLGPLLGALTGTLFVLGIMAVGGSASFVYEKF